MHPPVGKVAVSVAFVRPSVRLSVAYIANNWRTRRPSMPIRNLPHLWCHSHNTAVSRLKGQRLGSPGPLMLTHIMRYMLRTARPTNFKLGIHGWRTTTRISHRRMTSNVKSQGRKVTWSVWAVLAQCCTCVISGRRGHTVSADPGGHSSSYTVI